MRLALYTWGVFKEEPAAVAVLFEGSAKVHVCSAKGFHAACLLMPGVAADGIDAGAWAQVRTKVRAFVGDATAASFFPACHVLQLLLPHVDVRALDYKAG